jgi:hypothetical protein
MSVGRGATRRRSRVRITIDEEVVRSPPPIDAYTSS